MSDLRTKLVVVTRPRDRYADFANRLRANGAIPVRFPTIEISGVDDPTHLDSALRDLPSYDWLVFTSANAVDAVWQRLATMGIPFSANGISIAAIGPKTADALELHGVQPDFVPHEYVAEAILPGLGNLHGCKVLLPRADIARPMLPSAIEASGGVVDDIVAYHTIPAEPDTQGLQALRYGVEVITFTSSSTVLNFISLLRSTGLDPANLAGDPIYAYIGPITADTALKYRLPVDVIAQEYTSEGLIESLNIHFSPETYYENDEI
ncbi:MAG: uroporphyrinogen-III synthase [Chloroflexi bacterium]|nr:uroporphyrinogen-III synthase [Chloroflexota bacterium]